MCWARVWPGPCGVGGTVTACKGRVARLGTRDTGGGAPGEKARTGARKCTACTRVCCACVCGIGYVSTRARACCVLCLSAQGAWGRPRVAACACRSPLEVREAGRLGKDTFPQGTVDLPGAAVPRQVCQQQGIHPHTETLLSSTGTWAHTGARDGRALGLQPAPPAACEWLGSPPGTRGHPVC